MNISISKQSHSWSDQQEAIFRWFRTGVAGERKAQHLVVRARAGTGKTTTILEGIGRAPESNILLGAFNKRIAVELQTKLTNPAATAQTLHAIGFSIVRLFRDRVKVDTGRERAEALTNSVVTPATPDAVRKLVSKLHTLGREIKPHATVMGELSSLVISHDCVPDMEWMEMGYDDKFVERYALDAMAAAADPKSGNVIDFSDMIFLPVRNGWLSKRYDLVVVDEAQDMTTAQLEIAQGVCSGRICVVGDDRQAIYGFRGADSGSLDRLKSELGAAELGLKTTYRCGRLIVDAARLLVPDFEAGADHDGAITDITGENLIKEAAAGDFVLSRVNAPLVSIAMRLLRSGKRTRIAGRDIGAGLTSLVRRLGGKVTDDAASVTSFLRKVTAWETREIDKLRGILETASNGRRSAIESRMEAVSDQAEMLVSLSDNARSVNEIMDRIDALFTDDGLGDAGVITCSSVHKAKGLEADKVFILKDTIRGGKGEENNIAYVAITRAKHELVWVRGTRERTVIKEGGE